MDNLNQRLYRMRKYLRLSQEEFGSAGGVSQSSQNRYEQPGTDVPMSYLEKIYEKLGAAFNESWFYLGKGAMLKNNHKKDTPTPRFGDLSPEEARIVAEVGHFSEFLKHRPLPPSVKRRLLELLIESIDQALEEPDDDDPNAA